MMSFQYKIELLHLKSESVFFEIRLSGLMN